MVFTQENRILDHHQILQKIKRMAFEIYEHNFEEKQLVLAGIHENGYFLAQRLAQELRAISPLEVTLLEVRLHKTEPLTHDIAISPVLPSLTNTAVVLVDDVLNTGKTLAYTLRAFLDKDCKKLEIATLVNRHHTRYPISATYTGYSLATTLREHIRVVLAEEEWNAYLL
ncbi:phosphoribosyltransferase family protein [Rufibacter glacialis]|uniref:Phosphoribosyltransferase n=1 Tax=Rufibacter glacialis TaxID=1259555 RepID=A0A5M8QTL7_9BACT|nr:phosphoribosyltransferase family protein [Rufibacter glacialis]KAA6437542.1 phosphoribosyltransferase [Rufibacter glacialis]GGK58456.1 phosphoribosyltransferase [Rufibacter glacialis]